jgi:pimeloyl-ACP methyl ester carboxylesterase
MLLLPIVERVARFAFHRRGLRSRYLETRAGTVHAYDAWGSGELPTVVLLHGIGSAATPYAAVLMRLRRHARRVVAIELPGHGFSADPRKTLTPEFLLEAVIDALDQLVNERFVLVGHSLGGAIAIGYALEQPDALHALVLVSPAGARTSQEDLQALVEAFQTESPAEAARLLARLYHRAPWFVPLLGREFLGSLGRPGVRDLLASATLEDAPAPEELAGLTMPLALLWGRSERLLPPSHLDYFRKHLPAHAVVDEPEGFGHCPHLDNPVRLAERIVGLIGDSTRKASGTSGNGTSGTNGTD